MGPIQLGMVFTMLSVVALYGSWAMTRAVNRAEKTDKLQAGDAEHQREVFLRVRYWAIRALLLSVWLVAVGFIIEVIRSI